MVYSTRLFVLCLTLYYFVLVFFSPFSIAIISLGEDRTNLSAFRTFVRFAPVWFCLFPLPLGVWEGLEFVIVALPGLFSYLISKHFWKYYVCHYIRSFGLFVFTHILFATMNTPKFKHRGVHCRGINGERVNT